MVAQHTDSVNGLDLRPPGGERDAPRAAWLSLEESLAGGEPAERMKKRGGGTTGR